MIGKASEISLEVFESGSEANWWLMRNPEKLIVSVQLGIVNQDASHQTGMKILIVSKGANSQ